MITAIGSNVSFLLTMIAAAVIFLRTLLIGMTLQCIVNFKKGLYQIHNKPKVLANKYYS